MLKYKYKIKLCSQFKRVPKITYIFQNKELFTLQKKSPYINIFVYL